MCGLKESLSWIVTPNTTIWLTLCILGTGGGGRLALFDSGLWITILVDFLVFKVRLLVSNQLAIDCSSNSMVLDLEAGTTRFVSSAYLNKLFIRQIVQRSDALMTYETGPILEPWTIDVFMTRKPEIMSMTLVQWRHSEKYFKSISRPNGWLQFRNMFRKQNNETFIELHKLTNLMKVWQMQTNINHFEKHVNIW